MRATVNRAEVGERSREGDGLWTDLPGVPMLKSTADCLPVAVVRQNGEPALALLHAGRLGLLEGILEAGIAALGDAALPPWSVPASGRAATRSAATSPDRIATRFGPGAVRGRNLDLWTAAERILRDGGIERGRARRHLHCVQPRDFFSHRRDHGVTGRQGVIGYVA